MSYQDKLDSTLVILNEHNEAIGAGNLGFVETNKFISCIKAQGGTTEEALHGLRYENIAACLPDDCTPKGINPKDIPLVKNLAKSFRGKEEITENADKRPVSEKKVDRMTPRELVESFDPEEHANKVAKRLSQISKGESFIVFLSGRQVDVSTTLKLLMELKTGHPTGRETIEVDGKVKKVFNIGELPENYADENPLYVDRPLRPDGTCDQTNRSWEGVPTNVCQLVHIAVKMNQLKTSLEQAHNVLDIALSSDAFDKLSKRYQKAAVRFTELEEQDNLPKLKIQLGNVIASKGNRPFDDGRKVVWAVPPNPTSNFYPANHR